MSSGPPRGGGPEFGPAYPDVNPPKGTPMNITQADVAHLSDDAIRRMVLTLSAPPAGVFTAELAAALIRVRRERQRAFLLLELDAMNHDGPGVFLGAEIRGGE